MLSWSRLRQMWGLTRELDMRLSRQNTLVEICTMHACIYTLITHPVLILVCFRRENETEEPEGNTDTGKICKHA